MSQVQALSDPNLFLSALTTIMSTHDFREAAFTYFALYSVIEIGCPNQAKCSCNLSPGGRATRHLCPLNEKKPYNLLVPRRLNKSSQRIWLD